ncbi:MAG: NAD(P)-dependent oxidoreductase [Burkholderiales bacterium]|nr:NAD(P)-dependent oxidoreductase [Burkholderiales bacterium]
MAEQGSVGLVGLGAMGWPMAARLHGAGFIVHGYDVRPGLAQRMADEVGGRAAATLAALGQACDVVITMLPNSAIVEQVLFGDGGLAPAMRRGGLLIEMSSGVPAQTVALGARLAERGLRIIDAPVSGGVKRAVTGELAIMAGGAGSDVDQAEPILRAMGKSILRTGALGSGQAMKALNNLVSAAGFLVGVEAMLIGSKFGLDPAVMVDVLNASSGRNNSTEAKFKQFVLSGSYGSGFALDLMVKDLGIALEVARQTQTAAPLSALCRELWASAAAVLGPGQDHTAITRFSEMLAATRLQPAERAGTGEPG